MRLTDEFGTPDHLPPKPYIREGLRLEALYMLRETDIRADERNPRWAKSMPLDGVFGFQFNIDFHPTRRKFLNDDPSAPWTFVHTKNRNWRTDTDRAMLPIRSLVPVTTDGLIGTSKNIGVTSLVSAAMRVHGQMVLCGQASGTLAAVALKHRVQPREVASTWSRVREVQSLLLRPPAGAPGVALWPYHDLSPDDLYFEAVNQLEIRGVRLGTADSLDFEPFAPVSEAQLAGIFDRVAEHFVCPGSASDASDKAAPATWKQLAAHLTALGLTPPKALAGDPDQPLLRGELASMLWYVLHDTAERP